MVYPAGIYLINDKIISPMKKFSCIILICSLIFLNIALYGQDRRNETETKLTRKEKRNIKNRQNELIDSLNFLRVKSAIENDRWTLPVSILYGQDGQSIQLNNPENNISMNGKSAAVHLSFKYENFEKKGIARMNIGGKVIDLTKKTDKKGGILIRFMVFNKGNGAEVTIRLDNYGNRAFAEVVSPTTGSKIRYMGQLAPLSEAKKRGK
jgi:hypothetical protein